MSKSVLAGVLLMSLAACSGGGSSEDGPARIGDTGAVVDLPEHATLENEGGDKWSVSGSFTGSISLKAHQPMPSDYQQQSMVREANPPVLDHHGALTQGADGLIVFTWDQEEGSGRRYFVYGWLPETDGRATYCEASTAGDDAAVLATCRTLRKKGK